MVFGFVDYATDSLILAAVTQYPHISQSKRGYLPYSRCRPFLVAVHFLLRLITLGPIMLAYRFAGVLFLAGCLGAHLPLTRAISIERPVAVTLNGTLLGIHSTAYNQDFFLDVPYAAPPIGPLRFNSPVPYASTYTNRDASQYGAACIGYNSDAAISQVYSNYSEDCLSLNIVRPTGAVLLPVMIWIHGGGFQFGSGIDTR